MPKRKVFLQSVATAASNVLCRLNLFLEGLFSVDPATRRARDPEEKEPLSQAVSGEMRASGPEPEARTDKK